jgi:hypothetical protein
MTLSNVRASELRGSNLSPISKKTRAPAPDVGFRLEQHVCRHCFGRLLSALAPGADARRYVCSNCGAEAVGAAPDVLCSCGLRLKGKGGEVDVGVRCAPNPSPTPTLPSQIIAVAGESPRPNDSKSVSNHA